MSLGKYGTEILVGDDDLQRVEVLKAGASLPG